MLLGLRSGYNQLSATCLVSYSTARKYWCISMRRNLIRRHFVFLEFAAVGRKPQPR